LPFERLNAHRIFLSPAAEQEQIVATLYALREETQRLATLYERKLAALGGVEEVAAAPSLYRRTLMRHLFNIANYTPG